MASEFIPPGTGFGPFVIFYIDKDQVLESGQSFMADVNFVSVTLNLTNSVSQTTYAELDWERYNRYRPVYPPSLRDLIYRYHDRHPESERVLMVDIGGGVGISTIPFLAGFRTVNLLDPSRSNQETARKFLKDYSKAHQLQTKLDFTLARAEERSQHVKNASLAICATAAHWIDPDDLIRCMTEMLRPGGTLAMYSYWLPIFPDRDPKLGVVFAKAATTAMRACLSPGDDATYNVFEKTAARLMAGKTILDSIPVPAGLFEDTIRSRINPEAHSMFEVYRSDPPVPCQPLPARVSQDELQVDYVNGIDPEAEGWSFPVDLEWLHGLLQTYIPSSVQLGEEQHEALYDELDRIYAAECGSGSVNAVLAVSGIFATRKQGWI